MRVLLLAVPSQYPNTLNLGSILGVRSVMWSTLSRRVGVGANSFRGQLKYQVLQSTGNISGVHASSTRSISGFNTLDTLECCKHFGCVYCGLGLRPERMHDDFVFVLFFPYFIFFSFPLRFFPFCPFCALLCISLF